MEEATRKGRRGRRSPIQVGATIGTTVAVMCLMLRLPYGPVELVGKLGVRIQADRPIGIYQAGEARELVTMRQLIIRIAQNFVAFPKQRSAIFGSDFVSDLAKGDILEETRAYIS